MAKRKKILCIFLPSPAAGELAKSLKQSGFTVLTAHNFHSALQGLYSESPDAVLLDRRFAILDGLSSAAIIEGILPHAVVLLVNANDPNLPEIIETLNKKFGKANEAGASGS
jgi:DNA-binding response OmpR family regulator